MELTCKRQKREEKKILVHSSGSVLWHRNSAQGSFKVSCNTKGKENKPKVQCDKCWNVPLVSVLNISGLLRQMRMSLVLQVFGLLENL